MLGHRHNLKTDENSVFNIFCGIFLVMEDIYYISGFFFKQIVVNKKQKKNCLKKSIFVM